MSLDSIQFPLAVVWGITFLVLLLWFLWRQRESISVPFVVRHTVFLLFVYAGCLSLLYGNRIAELIFGREVPKGDPQEFVAGLVFLAGPILFFAMAALALGKNRIREFNRYLVTFKLNVFTKDK